VRRPGLALASVLAGAIGACDGTAPSSAPAGACGSSPAAAGTCASSDALWVASDYSSSAVGALSTAGLVSATTGSVDLGADPALAISRGRAFYVARDEDAIFELDPRCGTPVSRFSAHVASHSGSSDPQDVGVARDGSLWIPLYDVPAILVLAPDCSVSRTLDLSSYDGDGNPQAMGIAMIDTPGGEKAFVPLQRLNDQTYASQQPSWMLRIDVSSAKVEAVVVLAGRNPFTMQDDGSGVLWLAEPGNFDADDEPLAGVERFDTTTSMTSLVAHEAALGGSVAEIAVNGACGVAIVAGATVVNATSLVTFDASTGAAIVPAGSSPLATEGFDLQGLTWLDGAAFVGDRRRAGSGYPVHALQLAKGTSCTLNTRPDEIFLPQMPVAVRPPG
jgi:streptogramin lyase